MILKPYYHIIAVVAIPLHVHAGIDMHSVTVVRLSLFLSLLQCYLIVRLTKSESILIIVLPQSVDTEVSASWERGEEILPGCLKAIDEAKNNLLPLNLTLMVANSSLVTRYDLL